MTATQDRATGLIAGRSELSLGDLDRRSETGGAVEVRSVLLVGAGPITTATSRRLTASAEVGRVIRAEYTDDGMVGALTRQERPGADGIDEVRSSSWSALLADANIAAVVLVASDTGRPGIGGVLGAMRLLSACRNCATVRRIVVVSSAAVYPCGPLAPSFCDETVATTTSSGIVRDLVEIERLAGCAGVSGFGAEVVVLRPAPVVGPGTDTALARLLAAEIPVKPAGYAARLHLLHIDDLAAAIVCALSASGGTYNIAGSGIMTLAQLARQRGRFPLAVPHMLLPQVADLLDVTGLSAEDVALLRYGRCLDTTRARTVLGFTPSYPTLSAVGNHIQCAPVGFGSAGAVLLDVLGGSVAPQRLVDAMAVSMGLPSATEAVDKVGRMADAAAQMTGLPSATRVVGEVAARLTGLSSARGILGGLGRMADTAARLTGLPSVGEVGACAGRCAAMVAEQVRGGAQIDEFGRDWDFSHRFAENVLKPLFEDYLRLETIGMENIPDSGRMMVVANHSGTFPLDMTGLVYAIGVLHPARRFAWSLTGDLVAAVPYVGDLMRRWGCVPACHDNASRLLNADELVVVCPEGYKGLGKLYSQRYQLQRFGRGGFVRAALRSGAPLIPAAVFGAEEFYPMLSQARPLAAALGLPYVPITPTFPWLGPIGLIPRRSRLVIEFGEPIPTDHLGPDAAENAEIVLELSDRIRTWIQGRLDQRRSG